MDLRGLLRAAKPLGEPRLHGLTTRYFPPPKPGSGGGCAKTVHFTYDFQAHAAMREAATNRRAGRGFPQDPTSSGTANA